MPTWPARPGPPWPVVSRCVRTPRPTSPPTIARPAAGGRRRRTDGRHRRRGRGLRRRGRGGPVHRLPAVARPRGAGRAAAIGSRRQAYGSRSACDSVEGAGDRRPPPGRLGGGGAGRGRLRPPPQRRRAGLGRAGRARRGDDLPVRGVYTFPGHSYSPRRRGPSRPARRASPSRPRAASVTAAGIEIEVVSGGSTPSLEHADTAVLTEVRPGVYVFGDAQQWELGSATPDRGRAHGGGHGGEPRWRPRRPGRRVQGAGRRPGVVRQRVRSAPRAPRGPDRAAVRAPRGRGAGPGPSARAAAGGCSSCPTTAAARSTSPTSCGPPPGAPPGRSPPAAATAEPSSTSCVRSMPVHGRLAPVRLSTSHQEHHACHPRIPPPPPRARARSAPTRAVRHRLVVAGAERRGDAPARGVVDVQHRRPRRVAAHVDLEELHALPGSTYFGDIHCVTTWSKLDTTFSGVSVDDLLEVAEPRPRPASSWRTPTGYTTNLPLADVTGGKAWVVWSSTASRFPASTAVRSGCWCRTCTSGSRAKWVSRLELMDRGPAGLLGAERLPRPRRPVARAALPG